MRMKHKTLNSFFKCFAYLPDSSLGPNINLGRAAAPARKTKGQQRKQRKGGEWEKNFIKHCNNNCYFHSAHTHTKHTHTHTHNLREDLYTFYTCGASFFFRSSKLPTEIAASEIEARHGTKQPSKRWWGRRGAPSRPVCEGDSNWQCERSMQTS